LGGNVFDGESGSGESRVSEGMCLMVIERVSVRKMNRRKDSCCRFNKGATKSGCLPGVDTILWVRERFALNTRTSEAKTPIEATV
jgi:hypothetical protein